MREATAEGAADSASLVAAERDHEPERADGEPGAERLQVDELAPHEHQAADGDEHERDRVGGDAEGAVEPVGDLAPTAPPSQPSQSRVARKRPTATMPSPQSSG